MARKHEVPNDVVKVVKSEKRLETRLVQYSIPTEVHSAKGRHRTSFHCPLQECMGKVVARLHNHLRKTHSIKDDVQYRKLLQQAVPAISSQSETLAQPDDDVEDEIAEAKQTLLHGGSEGLLKTASNFTTDYADTNLSDNTTDDDRFHKACEIAGPESITRTIIGMILCGF